MTELEIGKTEEIDTLQEGRGTTDETGTEVTTVTEKGATTVGGTMAKGQEGLMAVKTDFDVTRNLVPDLHGAIGKKVLHQVEEEELVNEKEPRTVGIHQLLKDVFLFLNVGAKPLGGMCMLLVMNSTLPCRQNRPVRTFAKNNKSHLTR